MISETYKNIDDMLFLGEAIDAFKGDVCIGIEDMNTREAVAYERDEGESLVKHLKRINDKTVIFVVFSYSPPHSVTKNLLSNINIGAVSEEIGLLYYDLDGECPLYAIEVPDAMITKAGQIKENPFTLLDRLQKHLVDNEKSS